MRFPPFISAWVTRIRPYNCSTMAYSTLDTPTAGTGALVGSHSPVLTSTITDSVNGAVTIDLSGLNGPNNVDIDRVSGVNNDVFTLGNFGTSNTNTSPGGAQWDTEQHLVIENTNANNTDTIQWGSGAYDITDALHAGTHQPSSVT